MSPHAPPIQCVIALQMFLVLPMKTLSYTGTDGKDKSLVGIISSDPANAKQFICHILRTHDVPVESHGKHRR